MTCCSPTLVEGHDLENDPVMKDLRENFREEDVVNEKDEGDLTKGLLMGGVVLVLVLLVFWYLV